MAPIRRYLRITLHSVLEVRIYLENPALADSWLLKTKDPVLPRIIQAIRPYVIPKLREENERAKGKGPKKKRKGIKDTVQQDDFEVSIFLTETSITHTLLTKQKTFANKPRIKSNTSKLGVAGIERTTDQAAAANDVAAPILVEENSDEEVDLDDIAGRDVDTEILVDSDSDDQTSGPPGSRRPSNKKRKRNGRDEDENYTDAQAAQADDKKKLALKTTYEGFSIYGRILCLIVKRKGVRTTAAPKAASGSDLMENWVSTQAQQETLPDGDD